MTESPVPYAAHARVAHVGVAVHRLEAAIAAIGPVFGTRFTPIADDTAPGLHTPAGPCDWTARRSHAIGGAVNLELLEGSPGSTWDTPLVAVTHHLAYWTRDVPGDIAALVADGWQVELEIRDAAGNPIEFAYLVKPGQVRIELIDEKRRANHEAVVRSVLEGA